MRQLGQHHLEHDPGRDQPCQQILRAGLAPRAPHRRRRHPRQRRAGPERHPEQQEIQAGRRAMGFLRGQLAQHVAADRIGEERIARAPEDRDEPRQHQHQHPHQPPDRTQAPQPGRRAVEDRQGQDRQSDEHQDQRPLEQDAAGQRGPENRRRLPRRMHRILAALPGQVYPRHRAHRGDHGEQQHRVGLGEPRLSAEQDATGHHKPGQRRPAPRHKSQRRPIGQQDRADGADQGRNAVDPDPQLGARQAERRGGFNGRGLQPVDADRLLVADVVLEADIDEIAAFDHLLGGLGEPGLVAVDGGNIEETGQENHQPAQQQKHDGAEMIGRGKVERGDQPAAGIRRFHRLLACSKTPDLRGFNHLVRIR